MKFLGLKTSREESLLINISHLESFVPETGVLTVGGNFFMLNKASVKYLLDLIQEVEEGEVE